MSNPLSTFIMEASGVVVKEAEEEVQHLIPNHHHHHDLTPQPPVPDPTPYPTFLPSTTPAAAPTTFFTAPSEAFLTLPEQVAGEGLLGSIGGEGVSEGSLLYLDPNSALHVLVHHLPQPDQPAPPQLVEEDGSQEQFVVVGALKTDEDIGTSSPPTTCHVSVEDYLQEDIPGVEGGEIYLPQPQDPTPTQHLPPTPVLTLVGGEDDAGDEGVGGDTITLDQVPHITLEEIIQKFAYSPDSPMSEVAEATTPTTTTITALIPPSPPVTPSVSPRVKVKLLPEANGVGGEEGEDGCLYDVVVTYRCRVCGEGFEDKGHLLEHHHLRHKQGGTIKIRVTTSNTPTTSAATTTTTSRLPPHPPPQPPVEEHKVISIHSCGFCSKDFLGLKECEEHISKEHPSKSVKESGSGQHTQGRQVKYSPQPGILIGHRKSRAPGHGDAAGAGSGGGGTGEDGEEVEGKRKVKTPKILQEQFWLQKQRPKPVLAEEVEKKLKCSVPTCKYKFSSEANLQAHKECHKEGEGKVHERGFTCSHCSFKCDRWSACQLHLWKAHGQDIDLLTCGICRTYKTCTEHGLLRHQEIHSEARDHVCQTCGKGFKQASQLLNHQVQHITNPKDIPAWANKAFCEECQSWFSDKRSLHVHTLLVHLKVKNHQCPHCHYRCTKKYDLTVHMRQHTGERPHRCPLCGWKARDHNVLRRHKLGHQEIKPYLCPDVDCGFQTRHSFYFKRHILKLHPNNEALFQCQFCPLKTASLQEYITHSMKHEKELLEQKLKQARELAKENSGDITPQAEQQAFISAPSTTTTTTVIKSKTDGIKNHLSTAIQLNPNVEVISLNIDPGVETGEGGGVVVGEEGRELVPFPQVVSENDRYYFGLSELNPTSTTTTTPATLENGGGCLMSTPPQPELHPNTALSSEPLSIT